ncbi:uncharacterized protein DUF3592 [Roseimicrobium gellanilyticum]|uniref:Uncharacterized protein DUF3592 n=1 Tax=Roseimicrobium gellanilyticum TaxID=748857 RepID=A0A366HTR7_9BACT|nr:DUF3592 domain-containing protein [Roseimicrobium gellanilyticum]RBP47672.1 uncharacterized protein DUF3592 [Roseimicrobium gellanilyticum]
MKFFSWGLLGAVLVFAIGVAHLVYTIQWVSRAERAIGKAGHTSFTKSTVSKTPGTYTVYVTYATKAGEGKTVGLSVWSRESYPEGSAVPVIFHPTQPGSTRLDTFVDLWLVPSVLVLWGVSWLVGCWRKYKREQAEATAS